MNHKRVYRLYRGAALNVRKRRRRKLVMAVRQALHVPSAPNEIWSIDFELGRLRVNPKIPQVCVPVNTVQHAGPELSPLLFRRASLNCVIAPHRAPQPTPALIAWPNTRPAPPI